jgi:AcrR family transcriptional regulator
MAGKTKTPSKLAASNPPYGGQAGKHLNGRERHDGHGLDEGALGRGQVAEIQRSRILTAMVQEIAQRGAANVSVAHVVGRSGVSRRTFYEIFQDREDCFLAAFDDALRHVAASVIPAYEASGTWRVKMRAALTALLETLDYDPATGRLLIVESLAAGPKALKRRQGVLAQITPVIEQGQAEAKATLDPPLLTAEGIAGGVLSVLHARLTDTGTGTASLLELLNPLMGMIVLPYLGPAAVRKETAQPVPKHASKRPLVRTDPLQELPMRFTYRTMRVLMAIAELSEQGTNPSNRAVGQTAGIGDQGQASKLLARLHKLGLIKNEGGDPARGEPNAWTLTATGKQVHDTITGLSS